MTPAVLVGFIVTVLAFAVILSATLYDFRTASQRRFLKIITSILRRPLQPPVTILVYVEADQIDSLAACLRNIRRTRYHEYDVVVVIHGSRQLLYKAQTYCRQLKWDALRWCLRPSTSSRLSGLQYGYRRSLHGELALVVTPGDILPPQALKLAVARFVANEKLSALRLRRHETLPLSLDAVATDYLQASKSLFYKALSMAHLASVVVGQPAVMYQAALFGRTSKRKTVPCQWANAQTEVLHGSTRHRQLGRLLSVQLIMGLLAIAGGAFVMYQAATLTSSVWLVISWLFVSIWLLVVCIVDDKLDPMRRFMMFVSIPTLYFVLYARLVMWWVQSLGLVVMKGTRRVWFMLYAVPRSVRLVTKALL